MNRETSRSGGLKRWGFLVVILLLTLAGAYVGWRWLEGGRIEKKLRLVALKNKALGELENEKLEPAFKLLDEIAAENPGDPFAVRNLAVARFVDLERQDAGNEAAFAQKLAAARKASANLMAIGGHEAFAHWIEARIQLLDDYKHGSFDRTKMLASLESAAKHDPDNPAIWFEIYDTINGSHTLRSEPEALRRAHEALGRAYRLAPRNFYIFREWLYVQALAEDPTLVDSLEKARTTFTPLDEVIRREHRAELMPLIDDGIAAVKNKEWRKAQTKTLSISHLVKPDESQLSDVRRAKLHVLEFALTDYSPQFYEGWTAPPVKPPPSAIAFASQPLDLSDGKAPSPTDLALTDFNLDGRMDVLVAAGGAAVAYGRESATSAWRELARCETSSDLTRIHPADLFRTAETKMVQKSQGAAGNVLPEEQRPGCQDAHQGAILYGQDGVRILRYDPIKFAPSEAFAVVEQPAQFNELRDVTDVAPIDFDNDGDLDLAILAGGQMSLWMNRADATFIPAGEWSKMPPQELSFSDLTVADFDRDVDLDVLLCGGAGDSLGVLENLRHGVFRWRAFEDENYDALHGAEAIRTAEVDGNASWDVIGVGKKGLGLSLTRNPSIGVITAKASSLQGGAFPSPQLEMGDFDNDAIVDAVVLSEGKLAAFRGRQSDEATGLFAQDSWFSQGPADVIAFDYGDIDADGDLDLAAIARDGVVLLENQGGENEWLSLLARGQSDTKMGRSNHYGIGSLVEVRSKSRYQAQTVDRQATHFGLGQDSPADAVRIVWTTGIPQGLIEPQRNHRFCETMILKGSCPMLYTWTGERFDFYTDLLWAAPLGLQQAEGVLAPCRPWEYIKIPGDKLAIKDGAYEMQVTCELWEADYFDRIELIAIDHPGDAEIYSNEKVGPAEIAEFKVHTVMNRRTPIAARDKAGRDVLPLLAEADGKYMQGFERTFRQGLTEEHYLELDLGEYQGEKATLFLTGWIRPTDTSINISLSQDPTLDAPRPPYLLAPDASGEWREVRPFMGFPGGKPKTIAIDLAGVFTGNDHRLRIATSNEIYWDEAFFTVDEPATETRVTPLSLLSADLHYRGFSRVRPWEATQPETYDYGVVETAPKWPPMGGKFTRYGDVKELLASSDNRLVIMSSGDETTLRFAAPSEPPPAGWKRDFFLHSRGWDKDADLNTVHGQTVEPLPFAEMKSYPYEPNESYPDTPALRAWQREYQTREVDPNKYWKQVMRETK